MYCDELRMPYHKPTILFIWSSTSLSQLPRNLHPPTISTKASSHPLNHTILFPHKPTARCLWALSHQIYTNYIGTAHVLNSSLSLCRVCQKNKIFLVLCSHLKCFSFPRKQWVLDVWGTITSVGSLFLLSPNKTSDETMSFAHWID